MRPLHVFVSLMVVANVVLAQPALTEPPEFPQVQPGPQVLYEGEGCFLLAEGVIFPGDVDWMRVRIPRVSTRTVIDVDFPAGAGASAMLAMVVNGTSGFNIADNNNTRDLLCGLHGTSTPVGSLSDSAVDLRQTPLNATIDIAVTGAADTSFVGLHNESFAYEVWVYAIPIPCVDDASCDDAVACTWDQCDVDTGDCFNTPLDDACDDGFFCNGVEWCDRDFGCRTAPAPSCDDGVDCTVDYCDSGVDDCVNEPWDEYCSNDLFCDGDEVCDPVAGCRPGVPVDCDDGQDCTVDTCDEEDWRCIHTTADDACDDGQFCNGMEMCDFDAGCMNGPVPCPDSLCRESDDRCVDCMSDDDCSDGAYCNGAERCNTFGQCVSGTYPCGTSLCRESDDACVECVADQDCDDGEFCNGVEFCGEDGSCEMGAGPCGDALCRESDDRCVECLSDDHCEDDEFCNGREMCNSAGICVEGLNPCGDSMCHESDDRCVQCLADADCDDGGFCNGVEQCDDLGACVAGLPPCGNDFCVESEDRCAECMTDGDCSDGLFCNGAERCLDSGTCAAGDSPCPAGQACDEAAAQCLQHAFTMDIKPGVCPVKVMTSGQGNLPVGIVGVDVRQIDVNSVRLMRVDGVGKPVKAMTGSGQGPRFRDVSGPAQACACPGGEPDGVEDLVVSFKLNEVVKELRLDSLRSGAVVELQITGTLRDGTSMTASDCVTIHAPGRNGISSAQ